MLNIKKTLDELMQKTFDRVNSITYPNGHTINLTPGSVTRLILSCMNVELVDLYDILNSVHLNAYLSTASGNYLDLIGYLLNCNRLYKETDENYRFRISSQVTVMERCNELSVRLSLLNIPDVDDIYFIPYTHGSGSFTVYISSNNLNEDLMNTCKSTLAKNVAYGIRYEIEVPTHLSIKLDVKVMFRLGETNTESILKDCKMKLQDYLSSMKLGEEIKIEDIITICLNTSDKIYDVEPILISINGEDKEIADLTCKPTERFVLGEVRVC